MPFIRHIPFLRAVLLYSCTAFGGPLGHLGMMAKTFVHRRRDITEAELLEYNAFCQMLPGPSSTQTVALIALKRGGVPLALATLGIWMLPAFLIMAGFAFLVHYIGTRGVQTTAFIYILPMSVGFILYAAVRMTRAAVKVPVTAVVCTVSAMVSGLLQSPWVFPALIVTAGFVTNISSRRIPDGPARPRPVRWKALWLFGALFVLVGMLSEVARVQGWPARRAFNLGENFYRFGAIVWGGGQALLPMMLYQFVQRPLARGAGPLLSAQELATGYGLVQAVPGPVFSVCAFVGGLAMQDMGPWWMAAGCLIATVAVFLPSTLLLFVLFPLYQNLRSHPIIFRALEGIHAAIAGIVWASAAVLFLSFTSWPFNWMNAVVVVITFSILQFTRIPAPLVVVGWLLLGLTMANF